jgi:hypothetical protein
MTWFADGSSCSYFGPWKTPILVAAGWLDQVHEVPRGELPARDRDIVRALPNLMKSFRGPLFKGGHECNLGHGEPVDRDVPRGAHNIYVPSSERLWVAPELIVHYVDEHRYLPPRAFLGAAEQALGAQATDYARTCQTIWESAREPIGYEHRLVELDPDEKPLRVLFHGRDTDPPRPVATHVLSETPAGRVAVAYPWMIPGYASIDSRFPSPCILNGKPLTSCQTLSDGDILVVEGRRYRYESPPIWGPPDPPPID